MAPPGASLDPSKLINLFFLDFSWVCEALGNKLTSMVSNSHFGKRLVARELTTFGFHVGPHIPNVRCMQEHGGMKKYMEVYVGICRYMNVYGAIEKYIRVYGSI